MKKLLSIFLLSIMLISSFSAALYGDSYEDAVEKAAKYVCSNVKSPTVGSIGGEWAILGLSRYGYPVSADYYSKYYENVEKTIKDNNGILHEKKYTEYSRVIIALSSIGYDATNVAGYDLTYYLSDYKQTIWQGINGPIFALIALDSKPYELAIKRDDDKKVATKQMYIDTILARQLDNGGWNLSDVGGNAKADIDVTAMALQALSRYCGKTSVKKSINKAIDYLSSIQNEDGSFLDNSEVNSQVLLALSSLNISINDERFVKNGNNVLDALLSYQNDDGGFRNKLEDNSSNQMASEQALYALVGYYRYSNNKNSLYDMSDVSVNTVSNNTENIVDTTIENEPNNNLNPKKSIDSSYNDSVVCIKEISIKLLGYKEISILDFNSNIFYWLKVK